MPYQEGPILHVCTESERLRSMEKDIAGFKDHEARQNGSLEHLDDKVDKILERLPHKLPERMIVLEASMNQRKGAIGLSSWFIRLLGVGAVAAILEFLFGEGGWLHPVLHLLHFVH